MFRVGTSFIFSRIKSRSASVTLNLIVPFFFVRPCFRSFPFRGFGPLPNKPFSTHAPQRRRAKIRKWVPASYACYESFSLFPTTTESPVLPNLRKRKTLQSQKDYNAS